VFLEKITSCRVLFGGLYGKNCFNFRCHGTYAVCFPVISRFLTSVIHAHADKPGALLSVLEDLQNHNPFKYLCEEDLRLVSREMDIPLSRIYSVVTFYSYFNLSPQGKHTIVVCRGTACHTRGSLSLLEEAMSCLGNSAFRESEEPSFTTDDKLFTIKTVACFGQCALSPVVAIDGIIYSRMTGRNLSAMIGRIRKEEKV
jgi:NADH-quinone oxidoreductase subunit E